MPEDKITLSKDELCDHLSEQIEFLRLSADAYDRGFTGESKRLAVTIRVLLHDSRSSHALLGQLGRLNAEFISTAIPHDPSNIGTHGGLVMIDAMGKESQYIAALDDVPFTRWLPFQEWWTEPVFVDTSRASLSRKQLILTAADQDGGAHVDPTLEKTYAQLSRQNSMGWVVETDGEIHVIPNPERAAIRQIAHEVLRTLIPQYHKKPNQRGSMMFGGAMIVKGAHPPILPSPRAIGRNDLCPCGSGRKFKRCHGW
ncbi:hypothetical protein ANRL3_02281 [Anaerolineae bacterium]|nr:hypothetical protein ANRL3_02281 [Anaerolineae bacterium]